ncbi:MAG: VWA domain-containing protein [Bryobacteraceae bacterium]
MRLPLILGSLLLAAPQEEPLTTLKVDVDVVNVLCSVRDRKGALIANLTKDDFTVLENGKPREIKYFSRETDLPLTIGLLIDVSGSQARLIEDERRAAYQFFSRVLRKKDMAFLISFGSEAELLQDLTGSPQLLRSGLERLRVNAGVQGIHPGPVPTASQPKGTVLYDAVYLAATERLQRETGRKTIVMITDGVDMGSRLSLEAAIESAQKADVIVYSVYYVDPGAYGGFGMVSDSKIKRMSEETGGRLLKVERRRGLAEIFDELQNEMRSQYAIGFSPADAAKDGQFRKLEVRTRDKNLKVQARKGYYAVTPEP